MALLTEEQICERLGRYYKEVCGERETDEWQECAAVNVRRFVRDGKTVVLQCHVTTGEVTEKTVG